MELTQEHFDDIVKGLATKKGLEDLASKKDLYLMATAEEQKEISQTVADIKASIDRNTTTLDGIAKGVNDLRAEKAATQGQFDRHEKWIKTIAQHIGLKLEN